jgi:hypothetical protein
MWQRQNLLENSVFAQIYNDTWDEITQSRTPKKVVIILENIINVIHYFISYILYKNIVFYLKVF